MNICESSEVEDKNKSRKRQCPHCQNTSWPVAMRTLLHHVQFPWNKDIKEDDFFFCDNPRCEMAYFSDDTQIEKVKLRAFQPQQQAMLCYCFGISIAAYQEALVNEQAEPINTFILDNTRDGLCACEIKNPSSRCCWAKLQQLEKHASKI